MDWREVFLGSLTTYSTTRNYDLHPAIAGNALDNDMNQLRGEFFPKTPVTAKPKLSFQARA